MTGHTASLSQNVSQFVIVSINNDNSKWSIMPNNTANIIKFYNDRKSAVIHGIVILSIVI